MTLIAYFYRKKMPNWIVIFLSRTVFVSVVLCLSACDSLFIKRIQIEKPKDQSQLQNYEYQKNVIASTIDRIASDNNMSCKTRQNVSRYCSHPPRTLVAFEDKQGFVVCLFMLGTDFGKSKFLRLSETIEETLIRSLPNIHFKISSSDELPECTIPQENAVRRNP
jgi:hypothetical protein